MSKQPLQEVEEPGQKGEEEIEISKGREEEIPGDEEGSKTENPLDKYMKIILEAQKAKQKEASFSNFCKSLRLSHVWTFFFFRALLLRHAQIKRTSICMRRKTTGTTCCSGPTEGLNRFYLTSIKTTQKCIFMCFIL